MITVRTKSSLNVKEVAQFFSRNFPEAVLKVWATVGGERGFTLEKEEEALTFPAFSSPSPRRGTTPRSSTS